MRKHNFQKKIFANWILLAIIGVSTVFYAYQTGITGHTQKPGSDVGCTCHNPTPTSGVTVTITGPDSILANTQATYMLTISGGPLLAGGTDIAASSGVLAVVGADLQVISGELTHVSPKAPVSGTVSFQFKYTSPALLGNQILYANGNSVNFNQQNDGDQWNFAPNKTVKIVATVPVELSSFTTVTINNNVTLNWTTATETNNKGFDLERMDHSNMEWQKIAFVTGNGTSTSQNNYTFHDINLRDGNYNYRIKQIDFNGTFQYHNLEGEVVINAPVDFVLEQNYPNPFNPSTTLKFSVPSEGNVSIKLYSSLGSEVGILMNEFKEPGSYAVNYNAKGLSSGVYYYKMDVKSNDGTSIYSQTRKMILMK